MLVMAFWCGAWKRFLELVEETADMPTEDQMEFRWADPPPAPPKKPWWKLWA